MEKWTCIFFRQEHESEEFENMDSEQIATIALQCYCPDMTTDDDVIPFPTGYNKDFVEVNGTECCVATLAGVYVAVYVLL